MRMTNIGHGWGANKAVQPENDTIVQIVQITQN
jgi:hypothetical protein